MPPKDSRERILDAAWNLMGDRGATVTLADIAAAAGVSRQAVYLHFGSRQGLFVAVMRHHDDMNRFGERARAMEELRPAKAALFGYLRLWIGYIPQIIRLGLVLDGAALTDEAARAGIEDRMSSQHRTLLLCCQALDAEGNLRSGWTPQQAAEAIWSLMHYRAWEQLVINRSWSAERFLETRLEIIERTFLR